MLRTKTKKMAPKLATTPKASLVGWGFAVGSETLLHKLPSQQSIEQSVNWPVELIILQPVTRRAKNFEYAISLRCSFPVSKTSTGAQHFLFKF